MRTFSRCVFVVVVFGVASLGQSAEKDEGFTRLFTEDGPPEGWLVRMWNDLSKPGPEGAEWRVEDGVLNSGTHRGNWLVSEKTYGDFVLALEVKLTELGNSGVALRAPLEGDPAFEAMEFQIADFRYNESAKDSELTGGIYRAIAPREQVYKPTEWNDVRIQLRGTRLKATLNGVVIHDTDLSEHDQQVQRHDGSIAPPVKDRPLAGHIGFQHLSRDNAPVLYRNVRVKELDEGAGE
jgi:hypothetical protein